MSYTAAPEDGPTWMNRLPRISSQSRSQARTMSETSLDDPKDVEYPPGTLAPPPGMLRRRKEGDGHHRSGSRASSLVSKKRKSKKYEDGMGPGGPIAQSAIFPNRQDNPTSPAEKDLSPGGPEHTDSTLADDSPREKDMEKMDDEGAVPENLPHRPRSPPHIAIYEEGHELIFEDEDGEVLDVQESPQPPREEGELPKPATAVTRTRTGDGGADPSPWSFGGLKRQVSEMYTREIEKRKTPANAHERRGPARAYQYGNTIIVEDEDGEVVKTYELPTQKPEGQEGNALLGNSLKYMGLGAFRNPEKPQQANTEQGEAPATPGATAGGEVSKTTSRSGWPGFSVLGGGASAQNKKNPPPADDGDDKKIRFTIGGVGTRLTKEEFIKQMQQLDAGTRQEVVDQSNASQAIKTIANQDPPPRGVVRSIPVPNPRHDSSDSTPSSSSAGPARRPPTGRSPVAQGKQPSESDMAETAVERKRRLAVLAAQEDPEVGDDADEDEESEEQVGETPAERRRRQAALGMSGPAAAADDSEDEGTERVPPARRGIRFAPEKERGRR